MVRFDFSFTPSRGPDRGEAARASRARAVSPRAAWSRSSSTSPRRRTRAAASSTALGRRRSRSRAPRRSTRRSRPRRCTTTIVHRTTRCPRAGLIHSPDVPVFRDDEGGHLLEEPYACAFLTSPAPNEKVVVERNASRAAEADRVMRGRVERALVVAAHHRHRHLVLGAWGCGVFGNDPSVVADAFARALEGPIAGAFDEVVFAVLDWSDERLRQAARRAVRIVTETRRPRGRFAPSIRSVLR